MPISSSLTRVCAIILSLTLLSSLWHTGTVEAQTVPEEDITSGLQLHYSFDDPNNLGYDSSGHGHHATLAGTVPPSSSMNGIQLGAAYFDRAGLSRMDVPTDTLLWSSYTKVAWIYITASSGSGGGIIAHPTKTTKGHMLGLLNFLMVGANSYHSTLPKIAQPMTQKKWVQVALTYDEGTRELSMYVDGALATSTQNVAPLTLESDRYMTIGTLATTGATRTFPGYMDEVRVYERALTPAQIQALYVRDLTTIPTQYPPVASAVEINGTPDLGKTLTGSYVYSDTDGDAEGASTYRWLRSSTASGTYEAIPGATGRSYTTTADDLDSYVIFEVQPIAATGLATGGKVRSSPMKVVDIIEYDPTDIETDLQLYFSFDDPGDLGADTSGNGYDGTLAGTVLPVASSTGIRGTSAFFDRAGLSKITLPSTVLLGDSYTESAWVYATVSGGSGAGIVSHPTKTSKGHFLALVGTDLQATNSYEASVPRVTTPAALKQWTHIVATYDHQTSILRLYKDGVLVDTKSGVTPVAAGTGRTMMLGSLATTGATRTFTGNIDELRVYTRALSPEQVAYLYTHDRTAAPSQRAPSATDVSVGGRANTGVTLTGAYTFVDEDGDTEGASTYRWLMGSSPTGTFAPISGATERTYTVRAADEGKYLVFEVTPRASTGIQEGLPVRSAPAPVAKLVTYFHLLSTGQSLSVGRGPALSLTQAYGSLVPTYTRTADGLPWEKSPLVPFKAASVEAPYIAATNAVAGFANEDGESFLMIGSTHGASGQEYVNIKKGTHPYARGLNQALVSKQDVESRLAGEYRPFGVMLVHGETDAVLNTSTYAADIAQFQRDYEADLNALTGRDDVIPMFLSQTTQIAPGTSAVRQVEAHRENPGKVYLTGPNYAYAFLNDRLHLSNIGSRSLGEQIGKVMYDVLVEGKEWDPLMPTDITRIGKDIYVKYHVPVPPITFDTTLMAERASKGFLFWQNNVATTPIASVSIEGPDLIKISLASVPTGTDQYVSYGYQVNPPSAYGSKPLGGAANPAYYGGNVRDSDTRVALGPNASGEPLYNWAVTFKDPVVASALQGVTVTSVTSSSPSPALSGAILGTAENVKVTVNGDTVSATLSGGTWSVSAGKLDDLEPGTYVVTVTAQSPEGYTHVTEFPGALTITN